MTQGKDMRCLDENDVVRFLEGGATAADEDHIDACEDCRALVTAVGAGLDVDDATAASDTWELASGAELVARGAKVGRYVVLEPLGAGAMGVVYRAYDPELDRDVALKLVRVFGAQTGDARARFVREAQALARVADPHVVAVHDASTYGEHVFIAMELVEGRDLEAWLSTPRTWREIVERFVAAGRGLAAAHAAGVIHRDVKAANILVGDDGRTRITDFGLAVASSAAQHATAAGTPAYMSPEVARGEPADERSDQFSFALAVQRALPAPPRSVQRVIARALSADPAQRYPSMLALVQPLERTLAPRPRWPLAVAALAIAAGSVIALRSPTTAPTCAVPDARLVGVWDAPTKLALRGAFLATGHPLASDLWTRVESALDRYTQAWASAYADACAATHVRHEQSPELLDRRMACLSDELARLRAVTAQLASADRALVGRSISATDLGDRLARCSDTTALGAAAPLPATPTARARGAAATALLAYAEAISLRAKFAPAIAIARAAASEANAVGDLALEADAIRSVGETQWRSGDYVAALATLHEAVDAAKRANSADNEAGALLDLVAVLIEQGEYREALQVARLAESTLRASGDQRQTANLHGNRGAIYYLTGDYAAARRDYERALALFEKLYGPSDRRVGQTVMNLAMLTAETDGAAALPLYARALRIHETTLGPRHPEVALTLANRAVAYANTGQFSAAYADLERAVTVRTEVLGPSHRDTISTLHTVASVAEEEKDYARAIAVEREVLARFGTAVPADHPTRAHALTVIGASLVELRQYREALEPLEQALAIYEAARLAHASTVVARFSLARALWETGGGRTRAVALARRALADASSPDSDPSRKTAITTWLAQR